MEFSVILCCWKETFAIVLPSTRLHGQICQQWRAKLVQYVRGLCSVCSVGKGQCHKTLLRKVTPSCHHWLELRVSYMEILSKIRSYNRKYSLHTLTVVSS